MTLAAQLRTYARFFHGLPGFVRNPISLEFAKTAIEHRLADRENAFVQLAQDTLFASPPSSRRISRTRFSRSRTAAPPAVQRAQPGTPARRSVISRSSGVLRTSVMLLMAMVSLWILWRNPAAWAGPLLQSVAASQT
jgi:hypothetical protein